MLVASPMFVNPDSTAPTFAGFTYAAVLLMVVNFTNAPIAVAGAAGPIGRGLSSVWVALAWAPVTANAPAAAAAAPMSWRRCIVAPRYLIATSILAVSMGE